MLRVERAGLHDMAGAYRVCLLTGDAGADASGLYHDPDLLGHVYVGPYLVRGEGTQLVVVDGEGVAGFLLSTDDTSAFESWEEQAWWPSLRRRYPRLDDGSADARVIGLFHEPARSTPAIAAEYPAHLHIDLLARTRGSGMGRGLIERLLSDLRARQVAGVHFGVSGRNTNAVGFYEHLGFQTLEQERWGVTMGMRLG